MAYRPGGHLLHQVHGRFAAVVEVAAHLSQGFGQAAHDVLLGLVPHGGGAVDQQRARGLLRGRQGHVQRQRRFAGQRCRRDRCGGLLGESLDQPAGVILARRGLVLDALGLADAAVDGRGDAVQAAHLSEQEHDGLHGQAAGHDHRRVVVQGLDVLDCPVHMVDDGHLHGIGHPGHDRRHRWDVGFAGRLLIAVV